MTTSLKRDMFFVFKRVKTHLRQIFRDETLNKKKSHQINIESDLVAKFDTQKLIDEYGCMKVRRYPVL